MTTHDFLGRPIEVGARVLWANHGCELALGEVVDIYAKPVSGEDKPVLLRVKRATGSLTLKSPAYVAVV